MGSLRQLRKRVGSAGGQALATPLEIATLAWGPGDPDAEHADDRGVKGGALGTAGAFAADAAPIDGGAVRAAGLPLGTDETLAAIVGFLQPAADEVRTSPARIGPGRACALADDALVSTHRIPARQAGAHVGPGDGGGGFAVEHGPLRSPSLRSTFATGCATRIVCPLWQIATFLPLPFFPFPLPLPLPPFLTSLEIVPRGSRPPRADPTSRRSAVRREGVSESERSRASKRSRPSNLLSCEREEASDRGLRPPAGGKRCHCCR